MAAFEALAAFQKQSNKLHLLLICSRYHVSNPRPPFLLHPGSNANPFSHRALPGDLKFGTARHHNWVSGDWQVKTAAPVESPRSNILEKAFIRNVPFFVGFILSYSFSCGLCASIVVPTQVIGIALILAFKFLIYTARYLPSYYSSSLEIDLENQSFPAVAKSILV